MFKQLYGWVSADGAGEKGRGPNWGVARRMGYLMEDPMILTAAVLLGCVGCIVLAASASWISGTYIPSVALSSAAAAVAAYAIYVIVPGQSMSSTLLHSPSNPALKKTGNLAIVTGANTGIGKETAKQLALWGAHVVIGCRDEKKGRVAVDDVKRHVAENGPKSQGSVECIPLDLSDLASVSSFASKIIAKGQDVHLLVNNAGLMMPPNLLRTKHGHEIQFGTNHLGHYLLTRLLMEPIAKCGGRVVNLASIGHIFGVNYTLETIKNVTEASYEPVMFYGISKVCNLLFAEELTRKFDEMRGSSGGAVATAYSCHPGAVTTELRRHTPAPSSALTRLNKMPRQGAQTSLYLCAAAADDLRPGAYYSECRECETAPEIRVDAAKELWEYSEGLVKQYLP